MSVDWEWSKWQYEGSHKGDDFGFGIILFWDDIYSQVLSIHFFKRAWEWKREKAYFDVEPQTEEEKDPAFYKGIEILERKEEDK